MESQESPKTDNKKINIISDVILKKNDSQYIEKDSRDMDVSANNNDCIPLVIVPSKEKVATLSESHDLIIIEEVPYDINFINQESEQQAIRTENNIITPSSEQEIVSDSASDNNNFDCGFNSDHSYNSDKVGKLKLVGGWTDSAIFLMGISPEPKYLRHWA